MYFHEDISFVYVYLWKGVDDGVQERLIVNLSSINKGVFHPWSSSTIKLLSSYKFNCIYLRNETLYPLLQPLLAVVVLLEGSLLLCFVLLNEPLFF